METWNAPGSLLAPIFVGFHPPSGADTSAPVWAFDSAMGCLPVVDLQLRERAAGKTFGKSDIAAQVKPFMLKGDAAKPYVTRIRLAIFREGQPAREALERAWLWEAGVMNLKDALAAPAIPEGTSAAMFEVLRFSFRSNGIRGAAQLALLRHLWVETLRSLDETLIVFGGRHDWDDRWLKEKEAVAA